MKLRTALAALMLATVPAALVAQTSIVVPPSGLGYYQWGLNPGAESIWGQTFTVPATPNTLLTDLTWYMRDFTYQPDIWYQLFVSAWNGVTPTGTPLFTSALLHAPSGLGSYAPNTVTIGGLNLAAGGSYVWYAQAILGTGAYYWDSPYPFNAYAGGDLVYSANNGETWSKYYDDDFAFTANFADPGVVPEPATLMLLGTGLIGIVGVGLRRRRTS